MIKEAKSEKKAERYVEGIGRRKTATARVRLTKGAKAMFVNEKKLTEYFTLPRLVTTAMEPLTKLGLTDAFSVNAKVKGGGIHAQAEAVRLGIGRALQVMDEGLTKQLRALGFLTRDPRAVERKKYGLKKARRAPQWAKR